MTEKKKPDIVFSCKKCEHQLYVSKGHFLTKLIEMIGGECPNCGEERYENWILSHEGNYEMDNVRRIDGGKNDEDL